MTEKDGYLLALDGGTGSFRAVLFDKQGNQIAINQVEWKHPTDPRYPGSVGFDFENNWQLIVACIKELLASKSYNPEEIKGISADSFREGFILYDENQKELMGFSNLDSRAEKEVIYLKENYPSLEMDIYRKTGQTFALSALPRLLWVKNNEPKIYEKIKYINMLNDWITFKLTGKIISEPSNSSTSGIFDLENRRWLPEVAQMCQIKSDIFPEVVESGRVIGPVSAEAAKATGLSESSLVVCGGGDSQVGCIGLGSIHDNQAALFGGSFWQYEYNTSLPEVDSEGRVRINCHARESLWQYEEIAWSVGFVMRWYKDAFLELDQELAKEENRSIYAYMDEEAKKIPAGSYGLVATFADMMNFRNLKHASPTFTNFSIDSLKFNKYTFYRAIMENAALITLGHLKKIKELTGKAPEEILFAGGSAYSPLWAQIVCDVLGLPLVTSKEKEATALGAALLAGVGSGVYESLDEAVSNVKLDKRYSPNMENHAIYVKLFEKWKEVYKAQLMLADKGITHYMWIAAGCK